MILSLVIFAVVSATVISSDVCHFDGFTYHKGDVITIQKCLAEMTCLGDESYGDMKQLGGICDTARDVDAVVDGQTGCLFDGKVYGNGDVITIPKCLAQMTCLGRNEYSEIKQLGGVCP